MPIPPKPKPQRSWPAQVGYITATTRPLNCLIFVLPILVVHQVGIIAFGVTLPDGSLQINAALGILRGILNLFGSSAPLYLPGLIVVITLLAWHLAKGYTWQVRARTILGMAIESFLFAWPVWVFCNLIFPMAPAASAYAPLAATVSNTEIIAANAVLMIGAGIYEELLFRLALISLTTLLLTKVGNLAKEYALLIAAIVSALLFGIYHFHFMPDIEPFNWPLFTFYFVGGIYFTGLYVLRGFGITVGAHIVYDLIVLFWLNS